MSDDQNGPAVGPLRQHERARLSILEQVVGRAVLAFAEAGDALRQIRDGRLWREGHDSFDDYCRRRWSWARRYANKMIAAAGVARDLTPIGVGTPVPANEAQARALVPLPPGERRRVWAEAVDGAEGGQPTAADVAALAGDARAALAGREGELRLAEMEQRELRRRSGERETRRREDGRAALLERLEFHRRQILRLARKLDEGEVPAWVLALGEAGAGAGVAS